MKMNKTFGAVGGDLRICYLAEGLIRHGLSVRLCGFDKLTKCHTLAETLDSDILIFPIIPFENQKTVRYPYSDCEINLSGYEKLLDNKLILTGKRELFLKEFPDIDPDRVISYSDNELFAVKNSVPTAEGAIAEAVYHYHGTISGSKALVCGYGRIGKVLSPMLRSLGARVSVSARRKADLELIELNGFESVTTGEFEDISKYDLIFNTVPALILDSDALSQMDRDAVIIDLASKPGGVDFACAEKLGIKAIHALALPGRTAPKTAGEIIESSILDILRRITVE